MSQGTPTRETRIERHLMRQRGAGVRAITADFGFSFALPSSIAEQIAPAQPTVEPPSKRRRVSKEKEYGQTKHLHIREKAAEEQRPTVSAQQVGKSLSRDHETEPMTASTAPQPSKKPQRARRKLLDTELDGKSAPDVSAEEAVPASDSSKSKPARKPRSTVKKQAPIKAAEDTFIFGLKSKKKASGKGREMTTISEVVPEDVPALPVKTETGKAKKRKPEAPESRSVNAPEEKSEADGKNSRISKARIKTKPATKPAKDLDSKADGDEHARSEPAAQSTRPRRRAAVSATAKVALAYEEDLVPTDKLRRAPEDDRKPQRRRKAAVQEPVLATQAPLSEVHEDANSGVDDIHETAASLPPTRRDQKADSRADNGQSSRSKRTDTRIMASEPQDDVSPQRAIASVSEAKVTGSDTVKEPVKSRTTKRPAKGRSALTETDVNIIRRSQPHEELGKDIQNAISPLPEGSVCPNVVPVHNSEHQATRRASEVRPTQGTARGRDQSRNNTGISKSRGHVQAVANSDQSPNQTPSTLKSPTARKRHVVAADEDLDWLFEKPQRPRPAASRQPSSKVRRKRGEGNFVKEMDLDDLLDSIAGFSGKIVTSKRERAVDT